MNVSLQNICKEYSKKNGKKVILKDINMSLEIAQKNIYGLVGPNGAGKTTLLKIVASLLYPSSGGIHLGENDTGVNYEDWAYRHISFLLPGDRNLYYRNTLEENALYYGVLKGIDKKEIRQRLDYYLKRLSMTDKRRDIVGNMSSGERKKAEIIAALCTKPRLLIMDEPSWGLDIDAVAALKETIKDTVENSDVTVILSSHDINLLSNLCNTYYFLNKGVLKQSIKKILDYSEIEVMYNRFINEEK
ncbi:MAG: ABC transporter ATP-binding protein [Eubacterium sp.]|nr:ABC transporter ATP-binding protein [Eubacterium sp.]